MIHFLSIWKHRINHWYKMFSGTSYYHLTLETGRRFVPGQLEGYFIDFTGKADWKGKIDNHGIPYNILSNGKKVYFPGVLSQKALAHWDLWLIHKREEDYKEFFKIADWLTESQDAAGGWDTWSFFGQPDKFKYSAMTQGQALSVAARAYKLTHEITFEKVCKKAVAMMQISVPQGGVCVYEDQDVFLEEYPGLQRDTALNGWIFSLFGIYDYLVQFKDEQIQAFYAQALYSLLKHLSDYDAGYWTYYSNHTKRIASPFYHNLHIAQLGTLKKIAIQADIEIIQKRWMYYRSRRTYKALAIIAKGVQKMREPTEVTIIE